MRNRIHDDERAASCLYEYVRRHNDALSRKTFDHLAELFHADGELCFRGLSLGPFVGPEDITGAFERRPPRSRIEIGPPITVGDAVEAEFRSAGAVGPAEGTIRLEQDGGRIRRLTIHIGRVGGGRGSTDRD